MTRPTVLVVDDDLDALVLTTTLLASEGFPVISAVDVPQAIDVAREHPPDVVLLDHDLPVLPGLGAVERLRADPSLAHAAIVLVTGYRFSPSELRVVDGYLRKPYRPDALLETVERLAPAEPRASQR